MMPLNIQEYCEYLLENFLVYLIVGNQDDGRRLTNAVTISINHHHIMVNLPDSRLLDSLNIIIMNFHQFYAFYHASFVLRTLHSLALRYKTIFIPLRHSTNYSSLFSLLWPFTRHLLCTARRASTGSGSLWQRLLALCR